MIRLVTDFQRMAKERNITRWTIHHCSFCNYPCGYVIEGEHVGYDSGCDCTYDGGITLRSWDDIADHYNRNQPENNPQISKDWLRATDEFWGFTGGGGTHG